MKRITHLQLHQSVRARFIDRKSDVGTISDAVDFTLEELGLDVVNGDVVPRAAAPRRKK